VAHNHQPVDLGAVGWIELGQHPFGAAKDVNFGAENLVLDVEVWDLPILGVHHGHGHRYFLGWRGATLTGLPVAADCTIASKAATSCTDL
jgi:hypothetical protein